MREALQFLKDRGVPENVIRHSLVVAKYAKKFAIALLDKGIDVDVDKVEIGALLHDIGRSQTHSIKHGIAGAEILRDSKFKDYARFAETHIGAGISKDEATKLGLGEKDLVPRTLEEKIVAYIDDRVMGEKFVSEKEALARFKSELGDTPAYHRIESLFKEMRDLYGREWSDC